MVRVYGGVEDGEPSDDELERIARAKKLDSPDLPALIGRFRESLHKPAVDAALRKATYQRPASAQDVAESTPRPASRIRSGTCPRTAVCRGREGGILQGVFDRLVVLRDGSQIIGADVLDFKTDDGATPGGIDGRLVYYRPQLEASACGRADAGDFARDGFRGCCSWGRGWFAV